MFRLLSVAERGRQKQRLELHVAGICELEMLKQRHETRIISALTLHAPEPEPHGPIQTAQDDSNPDTSWTLNILRHQVGELRVDSENSSVVPPTDGADIPSSSGLYEQTEGLSPVGLSISSGLSEISPRTLRLTERPKSVNDAFVGNHEMVQNGRVHAGIPRSLSAPYPPLEGEDELWAWQPSEGVVEERTAEDNRWAQRVESYIIGLIQRRSVPLRPNKPRTSLGPESRGVVRQSNLCRKDPPYSPERHKTSPSLERRVWASHSLDEEQHSMQYSKSALTGILSTSLDFPCGTLDPSSSEAELAQYFHGYQHAHSPSSDELVNAQYIPPQPCCVQARAKAHRAHATLKDGHGAYSPERAPTKQRAVPKKCRFTEEKIVQKKPGRKAYRAQSENSLLGQRGVTERKYYTVERNVGRNAQPRARCAQGGSGHRRWRSTLELSQDEAEPLAEQPIRRSRKSRPAPPPCLSKPHVRAEYPLRAPLCLPEEGCTHLVPGESESSLSEAESHGSSSLSIDSDESGGLVWPQQLPPQLAPPSPPNPPGSTLQPKAFIKIKASHALKKKILRFRTGSLKVMTTV
ncbi:dapper homolog 3-like [Xyrauchen texanus]|uniref:dapper homolog 3-like n=1 Tax=Xyrauchen texanus TaxID=154827 RepID=UPI00224291C4|nr:dapper homolog 3-like [Xyrauchen texanus]